MSSYDIWILGYGTWILWYDFIHWWNDILRSQYSIVMWWCVIIMTNMRFNIEYCIIDLSDYDIKIEKNINNSSSGSGIFIRIWHFNVMRWYYNFVFLYQTKRFECQDIPFFMMGYDIIKSRYGGLGGILIWHYNDWIWRYDILLWS